MNHKEQSKNADKYAEGFGPPSSPPMVNLLTIRSKKQHNEVMRYKATEKARSPAGTTKTASLLA
jgi:hypothetical protein